MFRQLPPGLRNLLILIGLFFLAQLALDKQGGYDTQLYLYYPDSPFFRPWQLVTNMFCHGGIAHLLFNAIALYSFGAIMEMKLGTRKFLTLFFVSGFGAILVHFISNAVLIYNQTGSIFPMQSGLIYPSEQAIRALNYHHALLGASGALYGVLIGFVFFYPNEQLIFLFIPYPLKAKVIIPIILLLDIVGAFGQFSWDPIAHFAHIGGAITGYITLRIWAWNNVRQKWS
jgi:membrane associated rhomboid family serine protease